MAGKRGEKWSMAQSSRRIYLHETAHASLLASHVVEINKIMLASSSASWSGVNCKKRARNSAVHVKLNHILWRWNRLTARRCISQKIAIELNNGIASRMENNSIMLPQPLFPPRLVHREYQPNTSRVGFRCDSVSSLFFGSRGGAEGGRSPTQLVEHNVRIGCIAIKIV